MLDYGLRMGWGPPPGSSKFLILNEIPVYGGVKSSFFKGYRQSRVKRGLAV